MKAETTDSKDDCRPTYVFSSCCPEHRQADANRK